MFKKWNKKEVITAVICFAVYFALILATELPGFLSPLYWLMFPVLAAFVSAGPLTCMMNMKKGFGSAAALPLLWFIVNRLMGEIGMSVMWLGIILFIIVAELMRYMFGYDSRLGIRWCVPVLGLVPSCVLLPLYFDRAEYFSRANEEMAADYVAGLDKYGTIWMFALVTALCIAASVVSERISEKIIKIEG